LSKILSAPAWTPATEPGRQIRDGAWVAELTGRVLDGWPAGMRLIVRKERPTPAPSYGSPTPTPTPTPCA